MGLQGITMLPTNLKEQVRSHEKTLIFYMIFSDSELDYKTRKPPRRTKMSRKNKSGRSRLVVRKH